MIELRNFTKRYNEFSAVENLTFKIEPGELFGEHAAVFDTGQREEYAETMVASDVILIPGDEMQDLMQEHAELSLGIMKLIGLRRRRIERRLKSLLYRTAKDRLVHLLLELAEHYGKLTNEGVLHNGNPARPALAAPTRTAASGVTVKSCWWYGEVGPRAYATSARYSARWWKRRWPHASSPARRGPSPCPTPYATSSSERASRCGTRRTAPNG